MAETKRPQCGGLHTEVCGRFFLNESKFRKIDAICLRVLSRPSELRFCCRSFQTKNQKLYNHSILIKVRIQRVFDWRWNQIIAFRLSSITPCTCSDWTASIQAGSKLDPEFVDSRARPTTVECGQSNLLIESAALLSEPCEEKIHRLITSGYQIKRRLKANLFLIGRYRPNWKPPGLETDYLVDIFYNHQAIITLTGEPAKAD